MLPSDQLNQLEPHNAHQGLVNDPIQLHTQPSSHVPCIPMDISIAINSGSDVGVKCTSVSISLQSSSSSFPPSISISLSPPPSAFSEPVSSDVLLEPHPKRQCRQKSVKPGQSIAQLHVETNVRSTCDEVTSSQQTAMGGETTTQPTVQTTDENMKDTKINRLTQEIDTLKQEMDTLKQMIAGTHPNTMSDAADAQHTTTTTMTASAQDMLQQDKMGNHPPSTLSFADNNADIKDVVSPSRPLVVTRHDTKQFSVTPLSFPCTIQPVTAYKPYAEIYVENEYMIVPSMILYVLANNPKIMLPLTSFWALFFKRIHEINMTSFHLSCGPVDDFSYITKAVASVVFNRVKCVLHTLYPKAGIYDFSNDAGMEAMALELQERPVNVLQSIVRDGLEVWNPIRMLIAHLEGVTMQSSKCTTPEAQEAFRQHVADRMDDIADIADMAVVYGHYLWDSQWVSDDEWDTLAEYMNILTTKIFPKAYGSLLKMNSSTLTKDDRDIIGYFRYILGTISCCFLHHYRPANDKVFTPYPDVDYTDTPGYTLPEPDYKTAVASSTTLLEQCVVEYMNHPTAFPQFHPVANLLQATTPTDDDDDGSLRDSIMSEVDLAFDLHETRDRNGDDIVEVSWRSTVPMFYGHYIQRIFYLTDCIIRSPPHDDPVYKRISKIYPTATDVNRATLVDDGYFGNDDPQYQLTPVSGSNPR